MIAMINVYFCVVNQVTMPILQDLRQMRYPNIKLWFDSNTYASHHIVQLFKDKANIAHASINNELSCFQWDVNNFSVNPLFYELDGYRHLVSRSVVDKAKFVCVDAVQHVNNQLVFFRDAAHLPDYPKGFVKVPCFNSEDMLLDFLMRNGAFTFSLNDTNRFSKMSGVDPVQGGTVYKELKTGYFWYKDMLHKTHYEVFDKTGRKHLGEANLEGTIDSGKADPSKHLDIR